MKELENIPGIEVVSANGQRATIDVYNKIALRVLDEKGYKYHNEEDSIYLVVNPNA